MPIPQEPQGHILLCACWHSLDLLESLILMNIISSSMNKLGLTFLGESSQGLDFLPQITYPRYQASMHQNSHQQCLTLCDRMDCSLSGSSVHGVLQAGRWEWVAIPSTRGSSQPRDKTCISCSAGGFFTTEPPEKPKYQSLCQNVSILKYPSIF